LLGLESEDQPAYMLVESDRIKTEVEQLMSRLAKTIADRAGF